MARLTAAQRYRARKESGALALRQRTIAAADVGARHARLHAKYGPDWRRVVDRLRQRLNDEWSATAERNPGRRISR